MTYSPAPSVQAALYFDFDEAAFARAREAFAWVADTERALFMGEKMRVDYVYHTAALEGNPYTYPEVKTLIEGITVGGHKVSDTEQVLNLNAALTWVVQAVKAAQFSLDAQTACTIQGLVARGEALTWGRFRDGQVYIGGTDYTPPAAQDLAQRFERGAAYLRDQTDPVRQAWLTFLWGSLNQFFYDGNKRTARLLANGLLMSAGLPPLLILAQDQLQYNQVMTRFYDNQDATEALLWLQGYYEARIEGLGFAEVK